VHVPYNRHSSKENEKTVKRSLFALAGVIALVSSAMPALAATSIDVPVVASAPSLDPHANAFGGAATATLTSYVNGSQSANEPATVRLVSDGNALYVRFDVSQQFDPLEGFEGGDSVAVDLWDASGARSHLGVNLNGTHTSDSTPNTADWDAAASTHAGAYTVTMKIPLGTANGSHVQFSRWIASSGQEQVWSHDASQPSDDELAQAGTLTFAGAAGK
jgi:hypothetical protein